MNPLTQSVCNFNGKMQITFEKFGPSGTIVILDFICQIPSIETTEDARHLLLLSHYHSANQAFDKKHYFISPLNLSGLDQ